MLDIKKRKQFKTIGELKKLIKNLPDDMDVRVCGMENPYFHMDAENNYIDINVTDLKPIYTYLKDVMLEE